MPEAVQAVPSEAYQFAWINFLQYIVPLIAVFLSYICGRFQSVQSQKVDVAKLRYESFYVPYISLLYRGHLFRGVNYSNLDLEGRMQFMDLLFGNVQYLGPATLSLLPAYYDSMLNFLEHTHGNRAFPDSPKRLDAVFMELTNSVLLESKALSKSLHLPPLGDSFSSYLHTQMYKEESAQTTN